ncbi:MAG: 4Fe-4S dicluster domain-containing protein [Phycisphaerae bacterium]
MFRLGLNKLVAPLAEFIEQRLPAAESTRTPTSREVLRPPGALPETEFLARCYRCGNCAEVCPAKAIYPMSRQDIQKAGTPYIDPDLAACTLCDQLACIKACPSGALQVIGDKSQIKMGTATVDHRLCLRRSSSLCTICLDTCPIGREAIDISDGGELQVDPMTCVGCGVCQYNCPVRPRAIRVEPR